MHPLILVASLCLQPCPVSVPKPCLTYEQRAAMRADADLRLYMAKDYLNIAKQNLALSKAGLPPVNDYEENPAADSKQAALMASGIYTALNALPECRK